MTVGPGLSAQMPCILDTPQLCLRGRMDYVSANTSCHILRELGCPCSPGDPFGARLMGSKLCQPRVKNCTASTSHSPDCRGSHRSATLPHTQGQEKVVDDKKISEQLQVPGTQLHSLGNLVLLPGAT